MELFDCDMAYGRGSLSLPGSVDTVDDLLDEMNHCRIDEALVWHQDAWERGFNAGNDRLQELDAHPRLHPALTFAPTCCEEMPNAEEFLKRMQAQKVSAVRAFPKRHCFLLDPLACGDLLDLFCAHAIPVLIPLNEITGEWEGVYGLMRNFPRLTLILTQTGCWGQDRYFRPLMRQYARFYISTNRLETAGQLKSIVDIVGFDHLVFGSGLPLNYPGGYALSLSRAEISDTARNAIAAGNIRRLFREVSW